jgi:hypothetical protein
MLKEILYKLACTPVIYVIVLLVNLWTPAIPQYPSVPPSPDQASLSIPIGYVKGDGDG